MLNEAEFKVSLNYSIKFLKELNLYKGKGTKSTGEYSQATKKISKKNNHTDIYNSIIENRDYEILLNDDSLFQFQLKDDILRYSFVQNPNIYVGKDIFLTTVFTPEELLELSEEELQQTINEIDEEEYEQFLIEQDLNSEAQIMRYDLDAKGYKPLLHSYSHIHIGLNENFRLPCSKILTPLKFAIFAVKNTYYDIWKEALSKNVNLKDTVHDSKKLCKDLPASIWALEEKFELYMT